VFVFSVCTCDCSHVIFHFHDAGNFREYTAGVSNTPLTRAQVLRNWFNTVRRAHRPNHRATASKLLIY